MDATELVFLILTCGPFVLPLLYVLTILLRVSCHFAGVEIPALGRAFFTTSLTVVASALTAMLLVSQIGPFDATAGGTFALFVTFVLSLFAHAILAVGCYRFLLGLNFQQALAVWLIQALSFGAFAIAAGCLIGGIRMLLFQ